MILRHDTDMNWFYEMYHSNICKYRIFKDRGQCDSDEEELLVTGICKIASEILRQKSFVTHMPKVGKVVVADMKSVREASSRAKRVNYCDPDTDEDDPVDYISEAAKPCVAKSPPRKPVTRRDPPLTVSQSDEIIQSLKQSIELKNPTKTSRVKRRRSPNNKPLQSSSDKLKRGDDYDQYYDVDTMIHDFLEHDKSLSTPEQQKGTTDQNPSTSHAPSPPRSFQTA